MLTKDITNPSYLYFLGEGSNSLSISINKNFKYEINIQPVFNVSLERIRYFNFAFKKYLIVVL
jgi:hypothetical protein